MFQTYDEIFRERADGYHAAMAAFPAARREEFEHAVAGLDLLPGCTVCDVPAGGGYLSHYVSQGIDCLFLETSDLFAAHCPRGERYRVLQTSLEQLPLAPASVERVLSLAAMHHVKDKPRCVREFQRVLVPGGIAVVADVEEGTGTAAFLNGFVDRFNSMGHDGRFLNADFYEGVEACGLRLLEVRRPALQWHFGNREDMVAFCTQLFGLDLAKPADVNTGIDAYLGCQSTAAGVVLYWQLSYAIMQKTA